MEEGGKIREKKKKNMNLEKEVIPLSPTYTHPQGQGIVSDEGMEREDTVEDRRKASKVCNIGNLEIVKGIFGDRM